MKIFLESPQGLQISKEKRCASLDGDADRLIYFYLTSSRSIELLDGDHIAALFGKFIFDVSFF